jgi:hypothetical protein
MTAVETPVPVNTVMPEGHLELDLVVDVDDTQLSREMEPEVLSPQQENSLFAPSPNAVRPASPPTAPHQTPAAPLPSTPKVRNTATRERSGQVILVPTGMFAVDLAAELSAAISMRMAPPPEASTDRTAVFIAWVVSTIAGLGVWVLGAFHDSSWFRYLILIGLGMTAGGVLWRAYLSGRSGNLLAGLLTLLPPGCLIQLCRPIGQYRWLPLLFVFTGLALTGSAIGGPGVSRWIDQQIGVRDAGSSTPEVNAGPANRLRTASNKVGALTELASAEKAAAASPNDSASVLSELRSLLNSNQPEVRTAALSAMVYWAADEALAVAVDRLRDRTDRPGAKQALIVLGPFAESAVVSALDSFSEAATLAACEVLEQIGGEIALAELRKLADQASTRAVRVDATEAADRIAQRLNRTK